jgi:hypothetical protein
MRSLDGRFGSQYAAPEVMIVTSATLRCRPVR